MNEYDGSEPLKGRQETFCQHMAPANKSQTLAYRLAGYAEETARFNAARLITKDNIQARIAYIRAEWAKKDEVTRETIKKELDAVALKCLSKGEHSTYVRAVEAKMRLYGLDKQVVVQESTEEQQRLSEQAEQDAREFAQWKLRKQLKSRSAG